MSACCATDKINQRALDDLLEKRIEQERVAMTAAEDPESRRTHFEEMRRLIGERSAEQIQRMERAQGLRE